MSKLRRRYFIDPSVQGALVRRLMVHWSLVFIVLIAYVTLMQIFVSGPFKTLPQHLEVVWENFGLMFVCLLCLLPVFAYDAIKMSHRFAGPMVSFRRSLNRLAEGESIAPLKFRETDFWQPLAADLNRVAAQLNRVQGSTSEATDEEEKTVTV